MNKMKIKVQFKAVIMLYMSFWGADSFCGAKFGLEQVLKVVNRIKLEKTPFFVDLESDFGDQLPSKKWRKFDYLKNISINTQSRSNFAQEFEFNSQNYF